MAQPAKTRPRAEPICVRLDTQEAVARIAEALMNIEREDGVPASRLLTKLAERDPLLIQRLRVAAQVTISYVFEVLSDADPNWELREVFMESTREH